MQRYQHPLSAPAPGCQRLVTSFHYGPAGGTKVYLQSSLHADELPGMLVLHHLKPLLAQAEAAGHMLGEVVLVPVCNPIGLDQTVLHAQLGRFDLATAHNFNRGYPDFASVIGDDIADQLGSDVAANTRIIRATQARIVQALPQTSELESLRKVLLGLAHDADVVLDLHCDAEAVLHLYTEEPYWPQAEPLARYLGSQAQLLARGSGGNSFDESCSQLWWKLQERFAGRFPIALACLSATVELRGQATVDHATAMADAANLFAYLQHLGVIAGQPPAQPPLLQPPTPLAGSETLHAPMAGVLVFLREVGDFIQAGEVVFEIIDPTLDRVQQIQASINGVLFARESRRYATPGMDICKIAGKVAFRTGNLLGA